MDATQPTSQHPVVKTTPPALRLARAEAVLQAPRPSREEIETLLRDARALLASLKVDRSRVEARLAEFGRTDPIAEVKGRSALDDAVDACQGLIELLDQKIESMS